MEYIIIISIILGLSVLLNVLLLIVVRGMWISTDHPEEMQVQKLTGREIEKLRRTLLTVGMSAVNFVDFANLIHTINSIQIGDYEDKDPFVPQEDPYEDI